MQTAVLDQKVARTTTQRFEPRKTAEASAAVPLGTYNPGVPAFSPVQAPAPASSRRGLIVVVLILLVLLAGGGLTGVIKRSHQARTQTQVNRQFNYPGAHTILILGGEGGGVLQMETPDRLEKVSDWYAATLKPTKTLQVNPATVIMKNDKVMVTLAATAAGTSIVVKQFGP